LSLFGNYTTHPNWLYHSQIPHIIMKRKESQSLFALKLCGKKVPIFHP
jgi:hypothetical protein